MFCVKCGTQIPDDTIFCPSCGARLPQLNIAGAAEKSNNADTAKKHGSCLFIIELKKAYYGVVKLNVFIDGRLVKKLSSGETYSSILDNGRHKMYCECSGADRTQPFEFTGDDNEIAYFVEIFRGAWKGTIAVNKVKETQPGTYNG